MEKLKLQFYAQKKNISFLVALNYLFRGLKLHRDVLILLDNVRDVVWADGAVASVSARNEPRVSRPVFASFWNWIISVVVVDLTITSRLGAAIVLVWQLCFVIVAEAVIIFFGTL